MKTKSQRLKNRREMRVRNGHVGGKMHRNCLVVREGYGVCGPIELPPPLAFAPNRSTGGFRINIFGALLAGASTWKRPKPKPRMA